MVTLGIEVYKFVDKLFICYSFTKIFKVLPGPCTCAYFYPQSTCRSYGLHIYPLLVSAALLGVGRRGGCFSYLSPANTGMVGFCPLFLFLRGVSQKLE